MISLGWRFRGISSNSLETEVLPTYGTSIGGSDVLIAAQPYAHRTIAKFLAFGHSSSSTTGTSGTATTRPSAPSSTVSSRPGRVRQPALSAGALEPEALLTTAC